MGYLAALLALGLVVAVHELGHFLGARLCGMRVLRFSLGFGPPLLSFRWGPTEMSLGAIPLGGFVRIHGANPHQPGLAPGDPSSYAGQSAWRRALVVLAGPLANALFALALLFTLYVQGTHVPVPMTVGTVEPGSEAARAQLRPGDVISRVQGARVHAWSDFVEAVAASPGRPLTLEVVRGGAPLEVTLRPRPDERGMGRIGVSRQYVLRSHPAREALLQALGHGGHLLAEGRHQMVDLVQGRPEAEEALGPRTLTRQAREASAWGTDALVRLLAALSLALACVQLLPVPALDGGRLLFLVLEAATGRRLPGSMETLAHALGFAALALLALALAITDVRELASQVQLAAPTSAAGLDGGPAGEQAPGPALEPTARDGVPGG